MTGIHVWIPVFVILLFYTKIATHVNIYIGMRFEQKRRIMNSTPSGGEKNDSEINQ